MSYQNNSRKPYSNDYGKTGSNRSQGNFKKKFSPRPDFPELHSSTFEPEFRQTRPIQDSDFQSLINVAANKFGLGQTLKAVQICQAARHLFSEFLPELHQSFQPQSYKNKILYVLSKSPSHSLLLVSKKHLILEKLNEQFGPQTCTEIKIRLQPSSAQSDFSP